MAQKVAMKTNWRDFSVLKTAEDIGCYLAERTEGHEYFYHYTKLVALDKILEGAIRISCVDRFNDKKDKEQFGDETQQKRYFSACFTSGSNENLSLWYLYSGANGRGVRLGLSKSKLLRSIRLGQFYLVEYDYQKNRAFGKEILLQDGVNMKLQFRDMLYSKTAKNGQYVDLKYNTMTNHHHVTVEEHQKYISEFVGFNKSIIWYYEKETRLLIELSDELASKLKPNKEYAIFWKLDKQTLNSMKIMLAPEICSLDEADSHARVREFREQTGRISLSENAGDIKMGLCAGCEYRDKKPKKKL